MTLWLYILFGPSCYVLPVVSPWDQAAYERRTTEPVGRAVVEVREANDILWSVGPVRTDGEHHWARVTFSQDMEGERWGDGVFVISYLPEVVFESGYEVM